MFWKKKGPSRLDQMSEVASRLNLNFYPADEIGTLNLLGDFKLFRKGSRKRIEHLMWHNDHLGDLKTRIFDYRYTISSGKSSKTFKQTVFFVQSKALGLPKFYLRPEHFFHKIGAWLGIEDIDFEHFPVFSDQYHLKGEEEQIIREAFTEDVLHYFTIESGWQLEGLNYYLIVYKENVLLQPLQIRTFYHQGLEMHNLLCQGGYNV